MKDIIVNSRIAIPGAEIQFSFSRSPGPGGQNVNKVNSQATMKWLVCDSKALPPAIRHRFLAQNANRINKAGELVITSHEHRDQRRNVEACIERLRELALRACIAPRKRKPGKPSAASIRRRIAEKKSLSQKKKNRRFPSED